MKAIVYRCYGGVEVLKLEQIAKPVPADGRVLVKVQAASVNPLDWHYMQGKPYVMRPIAGVGKPNSILMGADFAGTVESIGQERYALQDRRRSVRRPRRRIRRIRERQGKRRDGLEAE